MTWRRPRVDGSSATTRSYRLTIRWRLTIAFTLLLTVAGALVLGVVYAILTFLPTYVFAESAVPATSLGNRPSLPSTGGTGTTVDEGALGSAAVPGLVVASRDDLQGVILLVATVLLVILAVGGAVAGWLLAGRILRPLASVNAAANQAALGQLDHRIALGGPRDEITDLADSFDRMLDGLERSVHASRRFAANASHELRTPLATTRAMLDVALATADEDSRPLLERLRQTNERSVETVEALLDLSEIESVTRGNRTVRLDDVARAVADECEAEAVQRGVALDVQVSNAFVQGDPALVRQLVLNLVQNAIRHNHSGGTAVVRVADARLTVSNTGPAVPQDIVDSLIEPFVRAPGRTADARGRGRGLGLSIVAAIATQSGAALQIASRDGGGLVVQVPFLAAETAPGTRGDGD